MSSIYHCRNNSILNLISCNYFSENVVFESFKEMDTIRSTSTNRSSPKGFNDDDNDSFEPIQPNFNSEQFNFNFNTNCFGSKIKKKNK